MRIKHIVTASLVGAGLNITCAYADDLMQVYQQATQNDPTFAQAQATWMQQKEALPLAEAGLFPTVDITGSGGYYYSNGTSSPYYRQTGAGATLTQPLFNIQNWENIDSASYSVKAATATYSAAAQNLMQRVATAYFTVLTDSSTLEYDQAEKQSLLSQLITSRQKYKVGLIAITSVYQVQSQYDSTVAQEISDRNQLQNDVENLRAITNTDYNSLKGLAKQAPLFTPSPTDI